MQVIGYYDTRHADMEWKRLPVHPNVTPSSVCLIYTSDFPGHPAELNRDNWQHIGYIFPDDNGGTIFPNKLTGGQNAVAAYVKREAPPKVEPTPDQKRIAELERTLATYQDSYRDKAAFAALSALVMNPNVKGMIEEIGALAYQVADAMLMERDRRNAAPEAAQE